MTAIEVSAPDIGPRAGNVPVMRAPSNGSRELSVRAGQFTPTAFERIMPAEVKLIAGVRAQLRAWMVGTGACAEDRDAIVLACSEAIANAVEHAYRGDPGGTVTVNAWFNGDTVEVAVHDDGVWADRRSVEHSGEIRGRGIAMMYELMDAVRLETHGGTTVTMARRLRPQV